MRKFIGTVLSLLLCIFILKVVVKMADADDKGEDINIVKTIVKTGKEMVEDAQDALK